ncbi:4'-phosphopantetheinyl transferase superfamily protein [Paenibacillus tyrfis]|uniref:4'-phosphopantetheinyl transferase superfamily protein n=1 Tax=Paenibacillus tyrfis TaxID=1501230 RepID=UPI000B29A0D0
MEVAFYEKEYCDIMNQPNDYFYDLWMLKESFTKTIGYGFSYQLSNFYISKNNSKHEVITSNT